MNLHRILAPARLAPAALIAVAAPARAQAPHSRPSRIVAAPSAALARRLTPLLDAPPFDRGLWGIAIVNPSGRLVFERNSDRLFVPASAAKLAVAATAAALLPDDYRFRTSTYAAGTVVDGVLQGDLVLYGRGDPTLSADAFDALADSLRAHGVARITGDVIGDASWFDSVTVHPSWETYDLMWWYAAPVTALGYNGNTVDVTVVPGSVGEAPIITLSPDLGLVHFQNFARTVAPGAARTFDFYRRPGTNEIWAAGDLPVDTRPWSDNIAVADGPLWSAAAFVRALRDHGIGVGGTARATFDPAATAAARNAPPLAELLSPPLDSVLRPILTMSHNWYAEMLLRTLGREFGSGGSFEGGVAVERRFLIDSLGVDSTEFQLVDGSGLSHHDVVAPRAFVTLMRGIREHPRGARFLAAMTVPGEHGTLRTRFRFTPAAGLVRAKTGSIANTNTLVGYLELRHGGYWTYAIQLNNHLVPTRAALRRIDAIVAAIGR